MGHAEDTARRLVVTTGTLPEELAGFINALPASHCLCGRPGSDGTVTLYACVDGLPPGSGAGLSDRIAARVAVEVVLQQVMGMPGTAGLLSNVREQFEGDQGVQAGWLSPPLTVLARLYRKTMAALPDAARHARAPCNPILADAQAQEEPFAPVLSLDQAQAVEKLIDKLVLMAKPGRVRGRI